MSNGNGNGWKNLIDPRVLAALAAVGALSGGSGSYLTAYASDEKVKAIVRDSPEIVGLKRDLEYLKSNSTRIEGKVDSNTEVLKDVQRGVDRLITIKEAEQQKNQ